MNKLAIGSDHAGFKLKEELKKLLSEKYEMVDYGCPDENSVHYPDIAINLAKDIQAKKLERGILVCGSGIGMSITANRFKGVRAALCHNEEYAKLSRQHNDANVLILGGRYLKSDKAQCITEAWLNTKFEAGRHQDRVDIIESI